MELTAENCALIIDALDQSSDTVFITDARGIIVYANPAFEKLTGYAISEAVGRNASILKSGEHTREFYSRMWNTINSGNSWSGRFVNRHKDGSRYPEESHITPVKSSKGEITHFIAIRHDITRELELENRIAQGQKMEALGLLAGQISHDFNNLLTIIIGSMELVTEDLKKGSVSMKLAREILKTSKESANLIKQLLIFARRQEASPTTMDVNALIEEFKILFDRLLGHNVKVKYQLSPDLYQVKMEPEQLKQVLMNLAINARDAMPRGGTITIATSNFSPAPGEDSPLAPGKYARIEVSDSGSGIPPDAMDHIFEPFFTTKPRGKGTGLGLSIVYGIVKQHKGEILAASPPGKGATFTIYLPKA